MGRLGLTILLCILGLCSSAVLLLSLLLNLSLFSKLSFSLFSKLSQFSQLSLSLLFKLVALFQKQIFTLVTLSHPLSSQTFTFKQSIPHVTLKGAALNFVLKKVEFENLCSGDARCCGTGKNHFHISTAYSALPGAEFKVDNDPKE